MGKAQKKTGKGRLDKYYKLAKEQGYRARSAFKLIQLNKRFNFLESAKCCIDLCAAPGGWLQVAGKYMPANSIIIGVDLVPIKPIPRVITFAADITTSRCRNLIRGELKDWKADVVLHDGAPNVGTAWIQDAYSQSELVLMSLKLAVEFLLKGGTFVTKVFRSADYNNLLWVFNQLFGKVEATKPPSSRNVSAEIFVVCTDFLSPKYIDPKFLDPKHVFKDLATSISENQAQHPAANNVQSNVFHPEKTRRKRDGYADGDLTLFKTASSSEFIKGSNPIAILGSVNKLTFTTDEEKEWLQNSVTTEEVRMDCQDLKVLGKRDFKTLIKWRESLRETLGFDVKVNSVVEGIEMPERTEVVDEEEQMQNELEQLNHEAQARRKRERRRANELKTRSIQRMQQQMTAPLDIGLEFGDAMLEMGQDDLGEEAMSLRDRPPDVTPDEADPADHLEENLDRMYSAYKERLRERDAKAKVKEARELGANREEWNGIQADKSEDALSDEDINRSSFQCDTSSEDDDSDEEPVFKRRRIGTLTSNERTKSTMNDQKANLWFSQDLFAGCDTDVVVEDLRERDDSMEPDDRLEEEIPYEEEDEAPSSISNTPTIVPSDKTNGFSLDTAEAVALAQLLVNRQTTRTGLINNGFNRYSLNSNEGLPSWFLDDEAKHYKANIPVTKEAINALRAKQRALDARPIKKIMEAKARKKNRAIQRAEKAIRKADNVMGATDMSEREKALQIEKLLRNGRSGRQKKKEIKLVVAKGAHKGIQGRPKGVKGRYTMVDSRMKKEVRARKRKEKRSKK